MRLPIALSLLHMFTSSEAVLEKNPQDCINPADYDAGTDFFPEKFVPHDTTDLLTVDYHDTYKIVRNLFQDKSYLLYQCGTEPPTDEIESGEHHMVVSVPHTGGVATTQTGQIPHMEMLAKRSAISAMIGNPMLVSSPCLNDMMSNGTIETIYYPEDPYNATLNFQGAADYISRNPDAIIFAGPTGNKDAKGHMAFAASQERTAFASFDWLGMYAALFNLEGMATKIIAETGSRYKCSADNAAKLNEIKKEEPPKLLWAYYFPSVPGWSVASCPTPDSAYFCEYAHHCGADIISRPEGMGFNRTYGSPTVYWYVSDEELLVLGKDADTWIYPGMTFGDVYFEKKEVLDQFKSVQERKVYDTQGQGEYSWHEQRLAEYDVVALDMCTIVGTNNPGSTHQNRWFRNYYEGPIGSPGFCDAPDEIDMAYVPAQAVCEPIKEIETSAAADTRVDTVVDTSADDGKTVDTADDTNLGTKSTSAAVVTNEGFATSVVVGVLALMMV